jgi:Periplasmic binding protein
MKRINGFIMLLACFACGTASAEISDSVVRVGVLNDISGLFQDTNGMGSVEAARMAAEDFDGGGKNIKVEIVYADHQNKADVGAAIARKWLGVEGVDAIVDVPNSAVGLTINSLLRDTRMTSWHPRPRARADAIGGQKHDLSPPDVLLWRVTVLDEGLEPMKIGGRNGERFSCAHRADSHIPPETGIPCGTQMLGSVH